MDEIAYGWWLPPNVSTIGGDIDHIINVVHLFMLVLFVGWGAFLVYCLIRFRSRPGHEASYESNRSKFPKVVEAAVVLFEVFLLVGLSFPVWSTYRADFPERGESLEIRVVAQQFVWNIHYAGADGQFGRARIDQISDSNPIGLDPEDPAAHDDIVTVNQLHFPVGRKVMVYLSSKDVIHSFFIPVLRVKQDAVPGVVTPVWFEATRTGNFEIACAQLCGVGHTLMRGFVTIDTPETFQEWIAAQEPFQKGGGES